MRKTLSRKSPFLPEVLPSLIKHDDITYSHENGQPVLLGEGSFGQACTSPPCCNSDGSRMPTWHISNLDESEQVCTSLHRAQRRNTRSGEGPGGGGFSDAGVPGSVPAL